MRVAVDGGAAIGGVGGVGGVGVLVRVGVGRCGMVVVSVVAAWRVAGGLVDQPIVEDSHALMAPQAKQLLLGGEQRRVNLQHPSHHLAQVAQVERVVRLGRDRLELTAHGVVQIDRGLTS